MLLPRPLEAAGRAAYRIVLKASYWSGLAQLGLSLGKGGGTCTIFVYHGVEPAAEGFAPTSAVFVSPELFERQVRFLKEHFHVVSLSEALQWLEAGAPVSSRTAVITFDDGYENNARYAYPILERYGLPFTIFLATAYIGNGRTAWWYGLEQAIGRCSATVSVRIPNAAKIYSLGRIAEKRRLFEDARRAILASEMAADTLLSEITAALGERLPTDGPRPFMSWDDVKSMARDPSVEFGSHSVSHPVMPALPEATLWNEVVVSKKTIEEMLGRETFAFAYPYGARRHYSPQVVAALKRAGYRCALTGLEGRVGPGADQFELRRMPILRRDSWSEFVGKAVGFGADLRRVGRRLRP